MTILLYLGLRRWRLVLVAKLKPAKLEGAVLPAVAEGWESCLPVCAGVCMHISVFELGV